MKAIKVLVLTTSFPLRQGSVSGLFVKKLVDSFPSTVSPLVVAPCDDSVHERMSQFNYEVKCFKYAPRLFRILAHKPGGIPAALQSSKLYLLLVPFFLISAFVKCFIEAKNVDLIHANWSICGAIGGIVGKLRSKPVITTLRGEDVNKAKKNLILKIALNFSIRYSSYIVCVSKNMVKNVKLISTDENLNIKFISNGISKQLTEKFSNNRPKTESKLAIVTVGSLTENKNTILVLEAVNKLVKQGENIVLNIIGDGPCRPILKDIIKKYQLQNQVYLHGSLDPKEVYEIVSKSNIFVLSSFREGRPNVILESMALGTLVIASKIEGVEEVIENEVSGLLFNPYNYDELVECIKRVSNEIELQKVLPRNALEYIVSNKLFWDETAKQYIELYKTVFTH